MSKFNRILNEKQLSVTFGFYARNGYYSSPEAFAEADAIIAAGIKWVILVATVVQESYCSTIQFRDFELTPSDDELVAMIDYFHSKGVKVQLRPMLEALDGNDRCKVWFPADSERIPGRVSNLRARWFDSMVKRSVHYARIAERTGCEIFCIDSELDRMLEESGHWKRVISGIREVYSGPVTSCHLMGSLSGCEKSFSDKSHWFHDLDFLSVSFYLGAADRPGATVDEMKTALSGALTKLRRWAEQYGKPILIGECGCNSAVGAAKLPWAWDGGKYDGEEQANYLSAVFETFMDEPWWMGLAWWKWDEQNYRPQFHLDPNGDTGFTVKGKPAEKLFAKYTRMFEGK